MEFTPVSTFRSYRCISIHARVCAWINVDAECGSNGQRMKWQLLPPSRSNPHFLFLFIPSQCYYATYTLRPMFFSVINDEHSHTRLK